MIKSTLLFSLSLILIGCGKPVTVELPPAMPATQPSPETVEARLQVKTLLEAQDDVEAQHAEEALRAMGPRAIPVIKDAIKTATPDGKKRLERVLKDIPAAPTPMQGD